MTFKEEFEQQWKGFSDLLKSKMIRGIEDNAAIDYEGLQRIIPNEIKRWQLPGQYQYAWLERLSSANPAVAQKFVKALGNFKIKEISTDYSPSLLPLIGLAAGGGATGFCVLNYLINTAPLITAIGTGLMVAGGGIMGNNLLSQNKKDAARQTQDLYMEQIKNKGEELAAIIAEADRG